jgi:hypothetical protein
VRDAAERTRAMLDGAVLAAPPPDHERATFERVRRFTRRRTILVVQSIAWALMPFAFRFEGGRITWIMMRDNPVQAGLFLMAAVGCAAAYAVMGRRVRAA